MIEQECTIEEMEEYEPPIKNGIVVFSGVDCELVIGATLIALSRLIKTDKRIIRVAYELEEIGSPNLQEVLKEF